MSFAYPTLVWWTKDGHMRACACTSPDSWRFVEKELGAYASAPMLEPNRLSR